MGLGVALACSFSDAIDLDLVILSVVEAESGIGASTISSSSS